MWCWSPTTATTWGEPMAAHRHFDKICAAVMALAVALTLWLMGAEGAGRGGAPEYERKLFDDSRVHRVELAVEDWDAFLQNAQEEEYVPAQVTVDGEEFRQIGLRVKGNNSRRLTGEYGLSRYSLKLEFDHYVPGGSYHGLDKFSLDASFQDNSYLKSWLVYDMMDFMEVPSPLCSHAWVTVNGEDWGLFLAVEEPEEGFARRNFGPGHGQLYKPDYRSLRAENADVALRYVGDDADSYPNIFENGKFPVTAGDERRLIRALKILDSGENLETAVNVEEVLRYFAVQVFVMNWDSYLGHTGHNYFLYEEDGILSILPWDYNLAFGTYALGMTDPIRDPTVLINFPINTPASGEVMRKRPLYHHLMKDDRYFAKYHEYFDAFLAGYVESGRLEERVLEKAGQIAPYVKRDPTAFCSYEDHRLAVETLLEVCRLRGESVRGQLSGEIPATIRGQQEQPEARLDASHIHLEDLGDFDDLRRAAKAGGSPG